MTSEGDIVIEKLDVDKPHKYCVGKVYKGVVEWVGKDFKLHRYQGERVLFTYESMVKIAGRLEKGRELC